MNGSNGIQPTIELATTNGNGFYPVYPMMYGNGNNNGGFFGGDGIWALVLLALLFGNNGWGGGFGNGGNGDFAWLSNGQKDIMTNTNNGFDTLHLSNQIEGVRDGVWGLSNQLCNCCADLTGTISSGFASAEVADNARQIANMQQAFNSQISTIQGFNNIGSRLDDCCCENRLGVQDLKATVISENCADREVLREIGQNILVNQTANTQKIIDEIFRDRLDEKNDKITELQRELLMKDLQASQVAQTAQLRAGQEVANTELLNLLNTCPIPSTPVYGRTPIFTCNGNNGCGCGNFTTSQFI